MINYIFLIFNLALRKINLVCREINIPEVVNRVAPKFQNGLKAFSSSPIVGEVHSVFEVFKLIWYIGEHSTPPK